MGEYKNYIDGQWVDGEEGIINVENPATGESVGTQACAGVNDVDKAVKAAVRCHESGVLQSMRPCDRGRKVRKIGEWFLSQKDKIANLLTYESGKPLWESLIEVEGVARYFEYYGNQAETLEGRSIPLGHEYMDFTVYEPFGVCAQIIPWNYPLEMTARSLSAALATGNSCVIKTPELDPLSSMFFASAVQEVDLPNGAVNIICGEGHIAGESLSRHKEINQLVFTGSVETGIKVATAAAANIVPSILELGGKSAAIVYPDACLDDLKEAIRWGIYFNAGQVCSAMSRMIIHKDIHDDVVSIAQDIAKSLMLDDGIHLTTFGNNMGPMISEKQRDRAENLCKLAESQGARVVCGARKANRKGWFLEPTVFDQVEFDNVIAQTEVFGPVLSIMSFETEQQAINMANNSQYGLVGGVFTADVDRAMKVARDIKVGQVFVNEWFAGGVETPFGGYKKSGFGREKGREALWNYVQTKNIAIKIK